MASRFWLFVVVAILIGLSGYYAQNTRIMTTHICIPSKDPRGTDRWMIWIPDIQRTERVTPENVAKWKITAKNIDKPQPCYIIGDTATATVMTPFMADRYLILAICFGLFAILLFILNFID